jgi:hypothetical protein
MGIGGSDAGVDVDDYGSGEFDPVTQTFEFYDVPDDVLAKLRGPIGVRLVSWRDIWAHRDEIEVDLHERLGVDLSSGILARRTARWLRVRVEQLLTTADSRIARAVADV